MKIHRDSDQLGGLYPIALATIRNVSEDVWTHAQQEMLHPRTIYSRALNKVTDAWLEVFDHLEVLSSEIRFGGEITKTRVVASSYAKLLHVLNEHIESCYAVMRCLAPPPQTGGQWHHKVVKKQRPAGLDAFEQQVIRGYRDIRLGVAVNLMKHDDARISLLSMRSALALTLGYFVDGPLTSGTIGPNRKLHLDGNSAFSFNRDMLIHWWWLHRSSELLSLVIKAAEGQMRPPAQEGLKNPKDSETTSLLSSSTATGSHVEPPSSIAILSRHMAEVRADFLIDEVDTPFPLVTFDPTRESMGIKFPSGRRANSIVGQARFNIMLTVDEANQAYKLPYVGMTPTDEITVELN